MTLKNQPLYACSTILYIFYCLHIFTFPHFNLLHFSTFVTIHRATPLSYRNIWSLYTQRSHIWSCRGSRKGLLTPSSSLPSDFSLPGGTNWPGRKMKAPGRLFGNGWTCCSGNPLELLFILIVCAQPDFAICTFLWQSSYFIHNLSPSVLTCFGVICVCRYVLPTHMMIKISEELPK